MVIQFKSNFGEAVMNACSVDQIRQQCSPWKTYARRGFIGYILVLIAFGGFFAAQAAGSPNADFFDVIQTLSAYGDRTTGSMGSRSAAEYIKDRFKQLGFETVESQVFSVPVLHHEKSTLVVPARSLTIPIRPIAANAITPETVATPGITAPLIYVGRGELNDFNGKEIAGATGVGQKLAAGRQPGRQSPDLYRPWRFCQNIF
jgi:hypothetical protein